MTAIPEALATAVQHHQGGRLQAAEQIYRRILAVEPGHIEAIHLLGTIAYQVGKLDDAITCWRRIVELRPDFTIAHYNLGLAFKDQGKFDDAAACWRQALQLDPNVAETHNNLGNLLREQGELDEAMTCYRRALELKPDFAKAHYNLGNVLRDESRFDEAAASFRRAIELLPNYAEAYSNLGNVLRQQGESDQAIACWRRTVELKSDLADAHYNLSVALTDQGNFDEAIHYCRSALALKPDFAEAHNNLGNALREKGNLDAAVASCRRAIELSPALADAYNNLGNALKDRGELDAAIASYHRAIELRPDFVSAHYNLGSAWVQCGDRRKAEDSFRDALRHDSRSALAHYSLAKLLRRKLPAEDFAAQERLLAGGDLSDSQRMLLHFGLAQVFDERGEYAAAAEHLEQANSLQLAESRRRHRTYDPRRHETLVSGLIETCTPDFFQRVAGFGLDSEVPVFVVGLPRSGTTLVEQILASHSQVYGAGEIKLAYETLSALGGRGGNYLGGLRQIDRGTAQRLAGWHLERLRGLNATALRIVDKLPDNYLHLGPLAALFPRAKFIHCRRDLRDVAVSCWITHFPEFPWANEREHILRRFRAHERIMEHWRKVLPGSALMDLDYEETVADLEGVARRLVAFCGLEWEPSCLAFHEAKRPVSTASAMQVRQPVYKTSVGRWKFYEHALSSLFARLESDR